MYKCRVCEKNLSSENFYVASNKKNTDKICKSCKHDRMQTHRKAIKQWAVEYKGGKCMVCGYHKYNGSLDFHHLDPREKDTKFSIGKSFNKEKLIKELDKCVLLCKNCHAEVHGNVLKLPPLPYRGGTTRLTGESINVY